jgi:hypothetical protein
VDFKPAALNPKHRDHLPEQLRDGLAAVKKAGARLLGEE